MLGRRLCSLVLCLRDSKRLYSSRTYCALFCKYLACKTRAYWETLKNNLHASKSLYNHPCHDFPRISLQSFKNLHYKNQWATVRQPHYHPWCRLLHATIQPDTHSTHAVGLPSTPCCRVEKYPMPTFYHASGNTFLWLISTLRNLIKWFNEGVQDNGVI